MVSIDFMYTCIPGYNVGQLTTVGRDMAKHHDLLGYHDNCEMEDVYRSCCSELCAPITLNTLSKPSGIIVLLCLKLCSYSEVQYNLGRWEDLSVSRQGMFDDTYHYIPTQGWMFVPLIQYHGGRMGKAEGGR